LMEVSLCVMKDVVEVKIRMSMKSVIPLAFDHLVINLPLIGGKLLFYT